MTDEAPPGDNGGHDGKLNSLNNALSDFASSYVKKELQQLTRERDDALARSHVPKLRALLREVDKERQAFEEDKEKLIQGLRQKLELLQVDTEIIENVITELNPVAPKYLGLIPSASTLTIRPPTPVMSPIRDNYFSTVLSSNVSASAIPPSAQGPDQGISSPANGHRSSPTNITVSPTTGPGVDHQVQDQVLSESSIASQAMKRSSIDSKDSDAGGAKRRRVDSVKSTPIRGKTDIFRKIAFPNLETGERIFRHSERQGFFVIRCDRPNCTTGFFTEPPLTYNRALKHFQIHGEKGPDGGELTNEYIFEKFACEIEGSSMVSKYWIKEHLGPSPHTFAPGKSRSRTTHAEATNPRKRLDQVNDKNYTPSSKVRAHIISIGSDEESEGEKPRRTPRSVVRPDYAELVANKDPWNSEPDSDKIPPDREGASSAH
ncbi:hypothetical protein AAE478_008145 [Parahypoxylon ruwenzoriense]